MKRLLLFCALACALTRLQAGTVSLATAGPVTTVTLDLTPLSLTTGTLHSTVSQCWVGTGYNGTDVTGVLTPQRILSVDALTTTSTTLHVANSVAAVSNLVCTVSTSGGAVAGGYVFVTGLLCAGPCSQNETSNWKWTPPSAITLSTCVADAQTYPTGSGSLTVDVLKNGVTSAFGTNPVVTMTSSTTSAVTATPQGAGASLNGTGDYLIFKVLTVTSGTTGAQVNVTCKGA